MSATVPTGSVPVSDTTPFVATPIIARARGPALPRPRTASPWPWSPPPPVRLAPGERLLWQGGPTVAAMAVRLYRIRAVAAYGVFLVLADIVQAKMQGLTLWPALETVGPSLLTMAGALSIFAALAWCSARTTRYTVTSHRVVMQCGLGMPKTIGIPLHRISAVAVRTRNDGTGDITLLPRAGSTLSYLKLWPFARPWRFRTPEPMLRDVPGAGFVASVLSRHVASVTEQAAAHEWSL